MINVKNLNGTADNGPRSKGVSSWREFWESRKGHSFGKCSCSGCSNFADVGAHVQKCDQSDRRWYIVPLCASCNGKRDTFFSVHSNDLVPVSGAN